ncbi:hypothetical protein HS1genome_0829 [Sulfodiicoccus acidiphilus]|uniref:Uncharacterized protein n=1 Tax=Sulfodiicoccus acidiphilus TaxID=1670455 RepID=A0A348B2N8_9CREN|nr:hypothetical protein HS1genome_0829 [Sulfodiicoccus acidiphilus]GGT97126.1 hypothetical protein GCM10007116_13290 [Sulfodiicoccus acidiphilus]
MGSSILQSAAIFSVSQDLAQARLDLERVSSLYVGFNTRILNLEDPEDKYVAVDVDPDMGDFKKGYAVLVWA